MRAQETKRVLLVADDRRFRALAATLLSRRGYSVAVCARGAGPAVGIVAASADSHSGLAALPVVPKWSPCQALFDAIDRAGAEADRDEVAGVAS